MGERAGGGAGQKGVQRAGAAASLPRQPRLEDCEDTEAEEAQMSTEEPRRIGWRDAGGDAQEEEKELHGSSCTGGEEGGSG